VLFIFLIAAVITWFKVWFQPYGAEIPIDKNFNIQEINKKKLYARTKTFPIFWTMFTGIVWKLEMEYWVSHCGNDAYLYLLF
jgi:hypothetical protein